MGKRMHNEFVSLKTATRLKDNGFNYDSFTYYDLESENPNQVKGSADAINWNEQDSKVSAPSIFTVAEWLLTNKNYYIEVFPQSDDSYIADSYVYDWIIWNGPKSYHDMDSIQSPEPKKDPVIVFLDGIEQCLDMIEGISTIKSDKQILENAGVYDKFKDIEDKFKTGELKF